MKKKPNEALAEYELMETLDKEWSEWLRGVPWDGYGFSIAESTRIFDYKRMKWMKKMVKKHNATMPFLIKRYQND